MVLLLFALFRAGFEPLSWRGDHGPLLRIESRFGFLGRYQIRCRGSKPARIGVAKEPNVGLAEFFALPFPGSCAVSPYRRVAPPPLSLTGRPREFLDGVAQLGCSFVGLIGDRAFQISFH